MAPLRRMHHGWHVLSGGTRDLRQMQRVLGPESLYGSTSDRKGRLQKIELNSIKYQDKKEEQKSLATERLAFAGEAIVG